MVRIIRMRKKHRKKTGLLLLATLFILGNGCASSNKSVKHQEALDYFNRGVDLYNSEQVDEAMEYYQKALEQDPDFAYGHSTLGTAFREQGRLEEAIEEYREAMRVNPKFSDLHVEIGEIYHQQGFLDKALAEFREALSSHFMFFETHEKIGDLYQDKGMIQKAIDAYEQALVLKPDEESKERIEQKLKKLNEAQ